MNNISIKEEHITLILVAYNSAHCIDAMKKNCNQFLKKIIVDNGSDDHTSDLVVREIPEAQLIRSTSNLGFGAANNRAIAQCDTPYALLLNPDCELPGEFQEALLISLKNHPDAAIIAPAIIRGNKTPEVSYRWPKALWKSSGPPAEGPCCVGFASGAALLLNINAMRDVGFFDEDFFLYYEDEDLCCRVFNSKKQIVVDPNLQLTHFSRGSVKGKHPLRSEFFRGYHHAQSKILFEYKYRGMVRAKRLHNRTLALALLSLIPRLIAFQPKYLARLSGRIYGLVKGSQIAKKTADETTP